MSAHLYLDNGVLYFGKRLVVPKKVQNQVLSEVLQDILGKPRRYSCSDGTSFEVEWRGIRGRL